MQNEVKVGDMVAWNLCGHIPWGTLFGYGPGRIGLCSEGRFRWVKLDGDWNYHPDMWGTGGLLEEGARWDLLEGAATIIALGLTGQETAADLQRLAEIFEVREALVMMPFCWHGCDLWVMARSLHAAGWRPGMTAEDAAHLLAEAGR